MNKLYDRIDFVNNTTPALNETNLNAMSKAVDDIDDRVIEIAGDVLVVVPEILDKYADIEALATNPPYVGQNGHWWTWDTDLNQYVDSGVDAGVSVTVGTTTTLPAGSDATVTNVGTDTDPILNFGIPQGVAGQNGQDGAPGVGVPSGGTTGQVLAKASGTDYDTEWINTSGGSGGHTIINDAGTSMTQRTGLQFEGMGVTDDSVNDKTVVTLPTPDYVDEQFNSSITYSKGMTCISGNKRYEYINNTPSSGHQPPNATYWEELSVASELKKTETIIYDSGNINSSDWSTETNFLQVHKVCTSSERNNVLAAVGRSRGLYNRLYLKFSLTTSVSRTIIREIYLSATDQVIIDGVAIDDLWTISLMTNSLTDNQMDIYIRLGGAQRTDYKAYTWRVQLIELQ